jgi:hypothetical protein
MGKINPIAFNHRQHGNTDTAMPFPYTQMLDRAIRFNHHPIRRDTALPSPHSGITIPNS